MGNVNYKKKYKDDEKTIKNLKSRAKNQAAISAKLQSSLINTEKKYSDELSKYNTSQNDLNKMTSKYDTSQKDLEIASEQIAEDNLKITNLDSELEESEQALFSAKGAGGKAILSNALYASGIDNMTSSGTKITENNEKLSESIANIRGKIGKMKSVKASIAAQNNQYNIASDADTQQKLEILNKQMLIDTRRGMLSNINAKNKYNDKLISSLLALILIVIIIILSSYIVNSRK